MLWCFLVVLFFSLVTSRILAPQQRIEPVPPALEGKVLTIGPPGKSECLVLNLGGPAPSIAIYQRESLRLPDSSPGWTSARLITFPPIHSNRRNRVIVNVLQVEGRPFLLQSICFLLGELRVALSSMKGSVQFSCSVVSDSLQPHGL